MLRSQMMASRTEIIAEHGAATGGHMAEAEAAVRIMQEGGNVVDAVVAAAFTGFVVEPYNCGVGGYGRLAIFLAEHGGFITVDHYVRAPGRARPDMFAVESGGDRMYYGWPRVVDRRNEWGHLSPAVPGAVAGLCTAQQLYGRLPRAQVLQPAIEAAEAGMTVTLDMLLIIADRLELIRTLPYTAALLLPNGSLPRLGDRLDASDLAGTLRRIAQEGPAALHTGSIAAAIERECATHGGILSAADLSAYRPKIMREKPGRYRGHDYITANDQVGYEALNILERFDLAGYGPHSVEFRHLMAEALGHAFVDNMTHYGDPDYTHSPVGGLASRAFAAARAAGIRLDRATPRPIMAGDPWPYQLDADAPRILPDGPSSGGLRGTSQMITADREGNMAALITSLSSGFGSLVAVPGTGIFLNNSMQNFDPRPERANCIAPGKMPIFAVPNLITTREGRAVFGSCGSGGYRITTGVLHTLINWLDFGMGLQAAIDAPRLHCQGDGTYIDARIPQEVRDALTALGHQLVVQQEAPGSLPFGRVNAMVIDPTTGALHAGSGPAWNTAAAGF